jgi:hypothetical protein
MSIGWLVGPLHRNWLMLYGDCPMQVRKVERWTYTLGATTIGLLAIRVTGSAQTRIRAATGRNVIVVVQP